MIQNLSIHNFYIFGNAVTRHRVNSKEGCKWRGFMANQKYEKRTDLAIEVRESFPKDHIEVEGVVLTEERKAGGNLKVTTVEIKDENGAKQMKKPIGTYVTL